MQWIMERKSDLSSWMCQKHFDRVWHKGLLYKLKRAGIGGTLLEWLKNYLTDRKQRVTMEGEISETKCITAGVPQGSILGPILFILYINDLVEELNVDIRLYADDVSLFIQYDNPDQAANQLQENIKKCEQWATKWMVKFNPQKTMSLLFSRKREPEAPILTMENIIITEVEEHRHLGLTLQKNGKWTQQIKEIKTKASKRTDILMGYMHQLGRRSLERLYTTYIRPIMEYGNIVWDNITDREANELEEIQIRAARIITGAKRGTSHRLLYEDLQWETLQMRRNKHKNFMMYQIKNKQVPETLTDLLPQSTAQRHGHNIRSKENITQIKTKTSQTQNSFFPSSIKSWNELTIEKRGAGSLEAFKDGFKLDKVNKDHLDTGTREGQILLARLRLGNSDLNSNLYNINLSESPKCECGTPQETPTHYILSCPNFNDLNEEMLEKISFVEEIDLTNILNGSRKYSSLENTTIINAVQTYILKSKRFNR